MTAPAAPKGSTSGAGLLDALLVLARPRLLPFVLLLPLAGFGWAHWDRALTLRGGEALLLVLAAWTLLHAGTLWLNAALDRDQGEVLMGRAVPVPDHARPAGYLALAACVGLGGLAGPLPGLAAGVCALLAVLYSHPSVAWKGHALFGPGVNLVGYGLLSPLAGWAVVEVGVNPRTLLVWAPASLGVLGCYFAAQAFQADEDRARGYRTLVASHGPRATLQAARACIGLGFLGGLALALAGWIPRIGLLALPLAWWVDSWLRAWAAEPGGGGEWRARGLAFRMLVSGLVVLGLVFAEYARASLAVEPVAGLGTAAGRPVDRPALPPGALRAWERGQRDARPASD